jgi:phage N-6-adenine-methyltransferase
MNLPDMSGRVRDTCPTTDRTDKVRIGMSDVRRLHGRRGIGAGDLPSRVVTALERDANIPSLLKTVVADESQTACQQRRALVAALHSEGWSLRAIAHVVGAIHPEQVRRDLVAVAVSATGVTTVTPISDRVRGRDGKSYPAVRPRSAKSSKAVGRSSRRLSPALMTSDSVEWYTPQHVVERVLAALDGVDLDPCADAGRSIPAARHYTEAEDGLAHEWHGRVYMNPPYARHVIEKWTGKLAAEFASGRVTEAIALVPARVDTRWWRDFPARSVCFVNGRLKFSGVEGSAPFPSALLYLGARPEVFDAVFSTVGRIYRQQVGRMTRPGSQSPREAPEPRQRTASPSPLVAVIEQAVRGKPCLTDPDAVDAEARRVVLTVIDTVPTAINSPEGG